jgi:hypothetical protein
MRDAKAGRGVMGRIVRFTRLSRSEQIRLLDAWLVLAIVRLSLWAVPLQRLLRLVQRVVPVRRLENGPTRSAEELARNVSRMSPYVPRATCLSQAVATQVLLARDGYPSRIAIGVARDAERQFRAHAWVECAGSVVIGSVNSAIYTPLWSMNWNWNR